MLVPSINTEHQLIFTCNSFARTESTIVDNMYSPTQCKNARKSKEPIDGARSGRGPPPCGSYPPQFPNLLCGWAGCACLLVLNSRAALCARARTVHRSDWLAPARECAQRDTHCTYRSCNVAPQHAPGIACQCQEMGPRVVLIHVYLSGTCGFMPTRSVFRGWCLCGLICAR